MWWLLTPYSVSMWSVSPALPANAANHSLNSSVVHLADARLAEAAAPDEMRPPRDVERDAGQRLVHRDIGVAIARDAAPVAERLRDRLPERDAAVLGGVVRVDVQVADRCQLDIDERMPRQLFEHVVEEADAGGDIIDAGAVEPDGDVEPRLVGVAADRGAAHGRSRFACRLEHGWQGGKRAAALVQ